MLNTRESRRRCENKTLAHLAFEQHGINQPPSFAISADGICDRDLQWRREDLLLQQMIWPARCWRVVVGREAGVVDPYWREPPSEDDRVLSISTGSRIVRGEFPEQVGQVATGMLRAVDGDLLAVDILETENAVYALEINHNFDAHGGDAPAAEAFRLEIHRKVAASVA